ncbi:MAG: c-type cytochrome [Verrucomicrobiales bacterium]
MKILLPTLAVSLLIAGGISRYASADEAAEKGAIVPPGKEERGLTLFVEKGCYQCHSAGATKLPEVDLAPRLVIELAGDLHTAWTRDDFAKAIMNPNHVVAEDYRIAMMRVGDHFKAENSPMPEFVDLLKVSDLIHLTTFLDSLSD